MDGLLIRGGTVVDGTGEPARRADVRVRGRTIAEVGLGLVPDGETELDATGALVTPGIIETHTHLDGAMWWDPSFDPLPSYGVTTTVFENCGMSMAPLAGPQRDEVVDLFCFLEDLPLVAFEKEVPWTWATWPEYRIALDTQPTAANIAGYVGHISLRTFVMGDAAWERPAAPAERTAMAQALDEALAAGALGLSTNGFDLDRTLRLVPSRHAGDDEYEALFDVLAAHPGTTFQAITRFNEPEHNFDDVQRFADLARPRGVRGQWTAIPTIADEAQYRADTLAFDRRLREQGVDFWPTMGTRPLDLYFNFEKALTFQRVPAWNDLVNGPLENKMTLLADPAWRDQARSDWDNRKKSRRARVDHPHTLIFALSETGVGPLGISLAEHAANTGQHVSDALASWLLDNGIGSSLRALPDVHDEPALAEVIRSPHTLTNVNDSGAHLQLFCGAGQSTHLLTHYHRDTGLLTLEEAVHVLTGRTAGFFGLSDRGVVAPGKAADLAVFSLDEISLGPEVKVRDVPGGSWRFSREPGGFRATIANGVATCWEGESTGELPGTLIGPRGA
ncbi:MAG: amidohydrolase family protein [bacterium]|nr:amidohydrolase family protein [bacterium]